MVNSRSESVIFVVVALLWNSILQSNIEPTRKSAASGGNMHKEDSQPGSGKNCCAVENAERIMKWRNIFIVVCKRG